MNKLITLLTVLGLILGSVPCIADEYDVPPVEVDDVLLPSERSDSKDSKNDTKTENKNNTDDPKNDEDTTKNESKDNENSSDSTVNKYNCKIDDILNGFNDKETYVDAYVKNMNSKKIMYSKAKDFTDQLKSSNHVKSIKDTQRKQLEEYIADIANLITCGELTDKNPCKNLKAEYDDCDSGAYLCISDSKSNKYEILIYDNIAFTWFGTFKINDDAKDSILYYLYYIDGSGFLCDFTKNYSTEIGGYYDFVNNTYKYKGGEKTVDIKPMEKLDFDIKTDERLNRSVFEDVAEINDTVHCTLDHYRVGSHDFILTVSGKKGSKRFCYNSNDMGWTPGTKLSFLVGDYIDDNGTLMYDYDRGRIYVLGRYTKDKNIEIGLYYDAQKGSQSVSYKDINFNTSILADNVKYNKYFDNSSMPSYARLSLQDLWNMPQTKEEYIKQLEEQQKEQDKNNEEESTPERTVSKYKYKDGDGVIHDYRMKYIAIMPVRADRSSAPAWYKKLGDNVKVSFILLCRTLDGEDFRDAMLVRFTGMNGTQWFYISGCKPNADAKDDVHTVDVDFDALVSFDGKKSVYNSVEHDSLKTAIKFDDDDYCIENVTLNIGDEKVNISNDEIKVIGSRKALSSLLG